MALRKGLSFKWLEKREAEGNPNEGLPASEAVAAPAHLGAGHRLSASLYNELGDAKVSLGYLHVVNPETGLEVVLCRGRRFRLGRGKSRKPLSTRSLLLALSRRKGRPAGAPLRPRWHHKRRGRKGRGRQRHRQPEGFRRFPLKRRNDGRRGLPPVTLPALVI